MARIARRQPRADRHRLHMPVHPEGVQHEAARALAGLGQLRAELRQQQGHGRVDRLAGRHRLQDVPRGQEVRRRAQRASDCGRAPVAASQQGEQRRAEAPGERRARLGQQVADAPQAEAVQRADAHLRQAQRVQGQGGDGDRLLARRHHDPDARARQPGRARRRAGDGGGRGDAGAGEARRQGAAQRLFSPMQMRDTGHVQQQPVRRVERRQRRDAERQWPRRRSQAASSAGSCGCSARSGRMACASATAWPARRPAAAAPG
jgi:hypothetical protein